MVWSVRVGLVGCRGQVDLGYKGGVGLGCKGGMV